MVSRNKAQRWLIQILDCKVNILAATRPPLFPLLTSVQLPAVQPAHNPHTGCAKQTHWGVLWGGGEEGGACHLSQVIHPSVASPIIRAQGTLLPPAISSCPCSPYQVLSCADYYLILANTLTAISTGNRWHYVLCFALVELKQFLHGYSTIVIQLKHSDSSKCVYTADDDDSLFLYCNFKDSSNFDIHSGPY